MLTTVPVHEGPGAAWLGRLLAGVVAAAAIACTVVLASVTPDTRGYDTHVQLDMAPCGRPQSLGIPCPTGGATTAGATGRAKGLPGPVRRLTCESGPGRQRRAGAVKAGRVMRTRYNKLKADYEASLRESYFTFAAQTYIVRWRALSAEQRQRFLADSDRVRRVRADQARFILHYLLEAPGGDLTALQHKVQKIAKYEQRELNVVLDSGGEPDLPPGFDREEIEQLFGEMKGKVTPEEAWDLWRTVNYNRLHGRAVHTPIAPEEMQQAQDYGKARAQAYLEHIEQKLVDIVTQLPGRGS